MTVQKPTQASTHREPETKGPARLADILASAARTLEPDHARNPSYVYAAAVREVIRLGHALDRFHYSDVLMGLRELGFALDVKKGLLAEPLTADVFARLER